MRIRCHQCGKAVSPEIDCSAMDAVVLCFACARHNAACAREGDEEFFEIEPARPPVATDIDSTLKVLVGADPGAFEALRDDFRRVTEDFWASPQITIDDVAEARARGAALVINNRPDGEAPEEPQGPEIEAAARAAGLRYRAIPVGHGGFSEDQIAATIEALSQAEGAVLAYCRSGTRSTLLWALAQARLGGARRHGVAEGQLQRLAAPDDRLPAPAAADAEQPELTLVGR